MQCSFRRDCPKPELCGQGRLVGLWHDNKITSQNKMKFIRNTCYKGHKSKRFLYGSAEAPFRMDWIVTVGLASISEDMASHRMHEVLTRAFPHVDTKVTPHSFLWQCVSPTFVLTFPALVLVGLPSNFLLPCNQFRSKGSRIIGQLSVRPIPE